MPIAIFITEWRTATSLNQTGVTTEAVIIDRRIDSDSDGNTYYVTYRMLFGGLFVLIGVWLIYSSWQGIYNATALARQGLMTTAHLTERWIDKDSEGYKLYCVAVRFAVPAGPEVHVAEYNRRAYEHLLEGDPVTVRYLPSNPKICRLEL